MDVAAMSEEQKTKLISELQFQNSELGKMLDSMGQDIAALRNQLAGSKT